MADDEDSWGRHIEDVGQCGWKEKERRMGRMGVELRASKWIMSVQPTYLLAAAAGIDHGEEMSLYRGSAC